MSKKRFERWNDHSCKVKDNQEDTFLNWEDVVQKLNEQQDTIEQLHLAIDDLLSHTSCEEIKKENEQLKKEYKIAIDEMVTDYKKLEKENEQLRNSTEKFWNVLTGFCEYVVNDERRIKQLKYDFRPLVLSYWITITGGSDE